jgi:hypothetical protein
VDKPVKRRVIGGPCKYKEYDGQARIVSMDKIESTDQRSGQRREVYDVRFCFYAEQEIKESFAQVEGKKYRLLLRNSTRPGEGFLRKYGVEIGKVFPCRLKVITRGTCTPTIFDFPTIDLGDYFETRP